MFDYRTFALRKLTSIAPRYLPFADVATEDVPLSRLLRLSLFQVTVGMAVVLLVGTLNRVMIVELAVPATLVAVMLALPLLFAPLRVLIGHKSDTHVSALGLKRIPYIWKGTLYQFGGFAIMPFALLVLSGYAEAIDAPRWLGLSSAALAFLLVGAGVHMVQTVGLALATDLVKEEDQPKVVGLMYVMLLFGMVVSALVYGALLENYTPGRLIQVIQGSAVVTVALNLFAMWKQEARNRDRAYQMKHTPRVPFSIAWARLSGQAGLMRVLVVIALGTLGFGAADVLLEPYGGQALGFSVAETTKLTALLAGGTLIGFGVASRVLGAGGRACAPCPSGCRRWRAGICRHYPVLAWGRPPDVPLWHIAYRSGRRCLRACDADSNNQSRGPGPDRPCPRHLGRCSGNLGRCRRGPRRDCARCHCRTSEPRDAGTACALQRGLPYRNCFLGACLHYVNPTGDPKTPETSRIRNSQRRPSQSPHLTSQRRQHGKSHYTIL